MIQEILFSLVLALAGLFFGVVCGGPLMSVINEFRGWRWKTPFQDKFAQQTARMSTVSLGALLLVSAATFIAAFLFQKFKMEKLLLYFEPGHGFPLFLWLTGFVLLTLYYLTWKRLKRRKTWHWCLGLLGVLALWLSVLGGINLILRLLLIKESHLFRECLWICLLWNLRTDLLWPVLGHVLLIALGCSGAYSTNYLLLRRTKDDFGRDYYRSSICSAARWSYVFCLQVFLLLGFICFPTQSSQFLWDYTRLIPLGLFLLFLVIPGTIWALVIRSENPLRNKISIVSALVCIWLALANMLFFYYHLVS